MPGRNFMNSPIEPSAMVPNSSAETTCMMLRANRCSLIAIAAPSISFEVETVKASSCTTSPAPRERARPVAGKFTSSCAVWPACTLAEPVCEGRPVKNTFTCTVPAGTLKKRYWPVESVSVSSLEPSIVTWAFSRYPPRPWSNTRPSRMPVAGDCARSGLMAKRQSARRVRRMSGERSGGRFMSLGAAGVSPGRLGFGLVAVGGGE
jgi:hypothetical protein